MKKMTALLMMILLLILVVSCTNNETVEDSQVGTNETVTDNEEVVETEEPLEETQEIEEAVAEEIRVTDVQGNEVVLEKPAERIVSGYYISSSTLIALGLEDKMVGVEMGTEKRPIYQLAAPELIEGATNVGSAKEFDVEATISTNPDLVILPQRASEHAATLNEVGIKTFIVNPETQEDLEQMILNLGTLTGSEERALALVSRIQDINTLAMDKVSSLTDEDTPVVYITNPGSYLQTAPKDMYQAELIEHAGGRNAGNNLDGDYWVEVSYEQILEMNPEIILIPTNNMANGQADFSIDELKQDAQMAQVQAVLNDAIYHFPIGLEAWDSPVPSGALGTLWTLHTLHPEIYSLEELLEVAQGFYHEFYDFELDEAILTHVE